MSQFTRCSPHPQFARLTGFVGATGRVVTLAVHEVMALFLIVQEIDGERRIFIQEAGSLIFARLHAAIAGLRGQFIEPHVLDDMRARRVPSKMIGRALSDHEAHALLDRIG